MTATEKAIEIYYLFDDYVESKDTTDNVTITDFNLKKYNQKQCALIAVDEVIDAINGMVNEESGYSADEYYLEVKTEIEKL